ncbi:MAG: EF-hand domain-containing protein, partial [Planctomycetota bacterium]|nr:EF-hand domain-containing protein [Planctomycetota bacterium]
MPRPSHAIHFIIGCILASTSSACGQEFNAQQQTQLLKRFPQFDKDGDGELSDSEQRTLLKQILKRYPQADRDGDGVLSEDEKQKLRQMLAARGPKSPSKSRSDNNSGKTDPKSLLSQLGLKGELDIEYRKNTKQQQNRLDFIYPKTKVYEQAPLFIYIHGGGNTGGTKDAL